MRTCNARRGLLDGECALQATMRRRAVATARRSEVGKPRMSMVATMAWIYRFVKQPDKHGLLYVAELLGRPQIAWASAGALAVVGMGLLSFAVRHLKRSAHPMVDLSALGVPTFTATVWGGSLFRMGVSAIPFLLPVMFQIGFGYDAFDAGLMMMTVFAGNLVMKPLTRFVKVTAVVYVVARHARPQTAIYATSARHSANAAERLCLQTCLVTRWRS